MTLYELNIQMQEILAMAESGEFDEDLIKGTLEGVEGEIETKLDSYGVIVNELQADLNKVDNELKRLTAKKKTLSGSIDFLKTNVRATLERLGKRTVKGDRFTWSMRKNGGKAPVIIKEGTSVLAIPEDYQDWDVRFNKTAIRDALENGKELDFAYLGERGENLVLK